MATPVTGLSGRPIGVIAGARENEQMTEVVAELAEVIRLDNNLPNCHSEAQKFTLLRTIIARLKKNAVARLRSEPARFTVLDGVKRPSVEWIQWESARLKVKRIEELVHDAPIPVMTTPEPTPIPTPSGTKYVYRMAGSRVLGTVFADDVAQVLPSLIEREDQRAFYRANMPLWDARDLAWDLVGELHIVDDGTVVALRVPQYTSAEADSAESAAAMALNSAAQALRDAEVAISDDIERGRDDEIVPIPYVGDD